MGIVYILSGFIVQHSQDITRILAATWLPYAILYFYKLSYKPCLKNSLLASLFYYLLMAGGYLSVSFMLFYVVFALFLVRLINHIFNKKYNEVKNIIIYFFLSAILIIILILPNIVTFFEIQNSVERFGGVTYEFAKRGYMPIKALISWIVPYAVVNQPNLDTDLSMRNIYFGLIPLLLFVVAIIKNRDKSNYFFIIVAIICLLASFGGEFFVHKFLFEYVPLMNLFRSPTYFNLITLICFVIIFSKIFQFKYINDSVFKKNMVLILITFIILLFITAIFSYFKLNDSIYFLKLQLPWNIRIEKSSFYENLLIHSVIQFVVLSIFLVGIIKIKDSVLLFYNYLITKILENSHLNFNNYLKFS